MKRIINGKRYDTKTATLIADHEYGHQGDLQWYYEGLYRTPKGNWFLAGNGGASSKYGERIAQNLSSPGENLVALFPEEALDWLERHCETAAIEQFFPGKIEDA